MIIRYLIVLIILLPINAFALIEVDITRGNLNPLPIAVSPLAIDEKSKDNFEKILKKENLGLEISAIVENNLKQSGLFNLSFFKLADNLRISVLYILSSICSYSLGK